MLGCLGALPGDYLDINVRGWGSHILTSWLWVSDCLNHTIAVWSLQFAAAVFVVACPCGIGLAAPTALLVGSGVAA